MDLTTGMHCTLRIFHSLVSPSSVFFFIFVDIIALQLFCPHFHRIIFTQIAGCQRLLFTAAGVSISAFSMRFLLCVFALHTFMFHHHFDPLTFFHSSFSCGSHPGRIFAGRFVLTAHLEVVHAPLKQQQLPLSRLPFRWGSLRKRGKIFKGTEQKLRAFRKVIGSLTAHSLLGGEKLSHK